MELPINTNGEVLLYSPSEISVSAKVSLYNEESPIISHFSIIHDELVDDQYIRLPSYVASLSLKFDS